jgi:hypothetical protein
MDKVYAPWTDEQVLKLKAWQDGSVTFSLMIGSTEVLVPPHPYTCCSHDGCNMPEHDGGNLIPSNEGWTCPCGRYKQDWFHDFMVEETPQRTLITAIINMLEAAKVVGFDASFRAYIRPTFFEPDDEPDVAFANQACSILVWWLRFKHNIYVTIEPTEDLGRFDAWVAFNGYNGRFNESTNTEYISYEFELIAGIMHALNELHAV